MIFDLSSAYGRPLGYEPTLKPDLSAAPEVHSVPSSRHLSYYAESLNHIVCDSRRIVKGLVLLNVGAGL